MINGIGGGHTAFYKWLKTFLRDRGLQFSQSGFKLRDNFGNHGINLDTGDWQNINYSRSKPIRWLFNIDVTAVPAEASLPSGLDEAGIGGSNTSQGDKAGLAVRLLPLFKSSAGPFERHDSFEVQAIFMFHGPLPSGSSGDGFSLNVATGRMKRLQADQEYIFAGLLGLRPRSDSFQLTVDGTLRDVTYGEVVDALHSAITIHPKGKASGLIPLYDLSEDTGLDRLKAELSQTWDEAGPPPEAAGVAVAADDTDDDDEPLDFSQLEVPENTDLLGVDPAVYRQINAMLKSGKQHIMLYGPPGTGKTSLARWIATSLPGGKWTLITGSSDWSSQDIIGGYQPLGGGDVDFVPGILLREFDRPLIIDELNRCDIDKVIGPLFTVLSGQQTTLPYRTDITDKSSQPYTILPKPKAAPAEHEFAPGAGWRLIATINSIDKASLYQMSYALSRRFGWVYVDAPRDLAGFIRAFLARLDPSVAAPAADVACPLAAVWQAINQVRVIGPAPIIDAILAMQAINPAVEFFGPASAVARSGVLDALDMVMLPMLDGIVHQDAMLIADAAISAFAFDPEQQVQIRARLEAVAI
jgi:5-methylcytosine-specific restriction protein B